MDNQAPFAIKKLKLGYSLANEDEFCWKYNNTEKRLKINSMEKYISLGRQVVYDCLFENKCLDIQKIAVLYHKALQEKGISESPYLIIKGISNIQAGTLLFPLNGTHCLERLFLMVSSSFRPPMMLM